MLTNWIRKALDAAGFVWFNKRSPNYYARDGLFTANNHHFLNDLAFKAAYARGIKASGGLDPRMQWRVHVALWAARVAVRIPGDFVECGVNAGFVSSAVMHHLNWREMDKTFYLIDTFNGPILTQFSAAEFNQGRQRVAEDAISKGAYVTDLARIRANYAEWPSVSVVQGVVPNILPTLDIDKIAFLHIDMNCAYPERAALEYFWERLSRRYRTA
ncbi:MAG: TylF/MycF/NovP-related O-methyltransferase [Bryobacteraceae bacterium]